MTITSSNLNGPCRPAFDRSGDLWAGNYNLNTVVEFTKAELARSGLPAPKVVISSSKYSAPAMWLSAPQATYMSRTSGAQVGRYRVHQGTTCQIGSPTPAVTIAGPDTGLNNPWAVAIEP